MFEFEIRLPLGLGYFTLAPAPCLPQEGTVGQEEEWRVWAGEEEMEGWQ